jgi:hypothetical protein
VNVLLATALPLVVNVAIITQSGLDASLIVIAVTNALIDSTVGLFAASNAGIGQAIFDSQIESTLMNVAGVVAVTALVVTVNGLVDAQPVHVPGEGAYFGPVSVICSTQEDSHG